MANTSLSAAVFSSSQKHVIIKPILKKPNLDPFDLKSYWPVSNLSFISKFLEHLVARRLLSHCNEHQLLPKCQSAYRPYHSTETALVCVINQVLCSIDNGAVCVLVLLDLCTNVLGFADRSTTGLHPTSLVDHRLLPSTRCAHFHRIWAAEFHKVQSLDQLILLYQSLFTKE